MNPRITAISIAYLTLIILVALILTAADGPYLASSPQTKDGPSYTWEEWGVWLVRYDAQRGRYLDTGWFEELPAFVTQYPRLSLQRPPGIPPLDPRFRPGESRPMKPVAWVFPEANTDPFQLSVRVDTPAEGGAAWPPCSAITAGVGPDARAAMVWSDLTVGDEGDLPTLHEGEDMGEGDPFWWSLLRDIDGAARLADPRGNREQFLFYESINPDGLDTVIQGAPSRRFSFRTGDDGMRVVIWGEGCERTELDATWETLRAQLVAAGTDFGLREAVAESLADSWEPEFSSMPAGATWIVLGTDEYDRLLPITLDPEPERAVRVGVIVAYP